jgi:hypothetical protein
MAERAQRLKERLLSSPYEIDIERAWYYSAYFTDLGKSIQVDIIARTNFGRL